MLLAPRIQRACRGWGRSSGRPWRPPRRPAVCTGRLDEVNCIWPSSQLRIFTLEGGGMEQDFFGSFFCSLLEKLRKVKKILFFILVCRIKMFVLKGLRSGFFLFSVFQYKQQQGRDTYEKHKIYRTPCIMYLVLKADRKPCTVHHLSLTRLN